jgi:D-alanyl-D-alanine carboxypeptidase
MDLAVALPGPHTGTMETMIHQTLEGLHVPRATIALIDDGSQTSFGHGDTAADARVPIFSITKTWTATLVLQLVDSGALALDAPVRTWLDHPLCDPAITVRHLLNHTSGLPDYGSLAAYHQDLRQHPGTPWMHDRYIEVAFGRPALFSPGTGWAYSNPGYMLLKDLLEIAAGRAFRDLVAALAARAGLTKTGVVESLEEMASLMSGLTTALDPDGALHETAGRYHPGWVSHGLIASTALDTARFLDRLAAGDLLSASSLAELRRPVRVPIDDHPVFRRPSYGLGVMVDADATDYWLIGHGGGGPGFSHGALTMTRTDGRRTTAVVFTNRDHAEIGLDLAWSLLQVTP